MKSLLIFTFLIISQIGYASVVKSLDADQKCTLYRVTTEQTPVTSDEIVVTDRDAYGLTFIDMDINFKDKNVTIRPVINIILGLNKDLTSERAIISAKNPDFKYLINQLNRRIFVFEKICINNKNEIIYAKEFESKETNSNFSDLK